MEGIIKELQDDLERSRSAVANMEKDMQEGQGQAARISALEKAERRMRDENKKLRRKLQEPHPTQHQLTKMTKENKRLKHTVKKLATASNEQQAMIKNLHNEIERATQLEQHQRDLISDLEKRLEEEKTNVQDSQKIETMEKELTNMQETLERTLIEKDFIEKHMLELDDSLEKAKETEAALERARKEIETLEQFFPDFETETELPSEHTVPTSVLPVPERPVFETDIPELNNIMEDNRLFGSLQEFWITLDTPPINLHSTQNINIPSSINDWVHTTIGENDYSVLLGMSSDLVEMVTQAIFKGEEGKNEDSERKDTIGELANIVAGTLATELNNNFPVGIPVHIDASRANTMLEQSSVVTEMIATAHEQPIYATLITATAEKAAL
jgi:CheY-specific phosphatase CheX